MERRNFFKRILGFLGIAGATGSLIVTEVDAGTNTITLEPRKLIEAPPTFWYENKAGDRWIPGPDHFIDSGGVPPGFEYQWSAEPCTLHESCRTIKGPVMAGNSGWSEDLVLAMTNHGYRLRDAIMIAAKSCERCMNALAHEHGLKWGYSRDSREYATNRTSCNMCVPRYAPANSAGVQVNIAPGED